jgi:hypothetical protein
MAYCLCWPLQLQRTIVLDEGAGPLRKRRMSVSEDQSVKFAEDEDPALASPSPPKASRRPQPGPAGPAVKARAAGKAAAPLSQRVTPAAAPATASPPAAAPRQPEQAADGGAKQEQIVFQPPKSLQELRKVSLLCQGIDEASQRTGHTVANLVINLVVSSKWVSGAWSPLVLTQPSSVECRIKWF